MVTHAGIPNLAAELTRLTRMGPGSRVLQYASLNFDGSVSEIATAFHAGAALVLDAGG